MEKIKKLLQNNFCDEDTKLDLERYAFQVFEECLEAQPFTLLPVYTYSNNVIPTNSKKNIITHYYIGACPRQSPQVCATCHSLRSPFRGGCKKSSLFRGLLRGDLNSPGAPKLTDDEFLCHCQRFLRLGIFFDIFSSTYLHVHVDPHVDINSCFHFYSPHCS